jgi:flagellar FliJ protein
MEPIKNLADGREREAGAVVAAARKTYEDAERQLQQLRAYREDYAQRLNSGGGAADGILLQNYHAFLGRLTAAIAQQDKVVTGARLHLEQVTDEWRDRRVDAASIGRAVEKIAAGERRLADARTQREDDERSMQRATRERDVG